MEAFDRKHDDPLTVKWAIIGAESGKRRSKVTPEKAWIADIAQSCKEWGIPVFMKESLRGIMGDDLIQEYPWIER